MYEDKIVLTGIKPTGTPHLGNLVGAIWPVIKMAAEARRSYVFIADLHALNAEKDPKAIKQSTYEIAASFVALGLDTDKTAFFRQSDIAEDYQLAMFLMNVTGKGLMNRGHAYKAILDRNAEKDSDPDDGVNMGLFTYPILMAADILLYQADSIPVGADQKQHVEFARDIAGSFNHTYGREILTMPEPIIPETANAVPGFDGRKMSKSYNNTIPIFAESNALKKLCMKIVTDSARPEDPKTPMKARFFNFTSASQAMLKLRICAPHLNKAGFLMVMRKPCCLKRLMPSLKNHARVTKISWPTRNNWMRFWNKVRKKPASPPAKHWKKSQKPCWGGGCAGVANLPPSHSAIVSTDHNKHK